MMSVLVYILLATYLATVQTVPGKKCTNISQCDPGECCQILSEYQVVSRRDVAVPILPENQKSGTCQLYKRQGEWCDIFAKTNGYCGCAPGLTCHHEPPSTTPSLSKAKRDLAPGTYTCEPE